MVEKQVSRNRLKQKSFRNSTLQFIITPLFDYTFIKLPNRCPSSWNTFRIFIIGYILNPRWPCHIGNYIFIKMMLYIQLHLYVRSIMLWLQISETLMNNLLVFSTKLQKDYWGNMQGSINYFSSISKIIIKKEGWLLLHKATTSLN